MKHYFQSFLQIFVWLWQLPQVVVGCLWCIIARPRYLYSHHHVHLFTCRFGGGVESLRSINRGATRELLRPVFVSIGDHSNPRLNFKGGQMNL